MEIKIAMCGKYLIVEEKILSISKDFHTKGKSTNVTERTITKIIELGDIKITNEKIKYYDHGEIITVDGIVIIIHNKYGETKINIIIDKKTKLKELIKLMTNRFKQFIVFDEKVFELNKYLNKLVGKHEIIKINTI